MPPLTIPTLSQVSAGGVTFRRTAAGKEIALVRVGRDRWQLPKGLLNAGESVEAAALRETREETGLDADLIAPLEPIDYWYVGMTGKGRVRYHKIVHFFLLEYRTGDVADHDHEVAEARWIPIDQVVSRLTFPSERRVAEEAVALLMDE